MNYKISFYRPAVVLVSFWLGNNFFIPEAHAVLGSIGFDSSSFVYSSNARGTSATSVDASLEGQTDSSVFHAQADFELDTYVTDNPELGFSSKNAFVSTQKDLLPNQEFTIGRRAYEWSKVDHEWTMMSLWSPRYTWDEIHPDTVGMTGAFYEYKTKNVQFLAFGSPVAIPELGAPTEEKDHQIVSPNPLWNPLPTSLPIMGVQTNIQYNLQTPPLSEILFRPNFALRFRYDFDNGYWMSANSGVQPVNMVQLAAEPFVGTAGTQNGDLVVNIHPEFPMRNINTVETGFDSPDKKWDLWFSASYEQPFNFQNQPTWLNPVITNTNIFSAGTDIQLTSNFSFNGGVLFIHESPFNVASDLPAVNVQIPSRYPLKQGIQVGGSLRFSDYTQSRFSWIQDLIEQTHFVSFDIQHHIRHTNVHIGAGADLFFTDTTDGWVGQYYADDRVRGWLKYDF